MRNRNDESGLGKTVGDFVTGGARGVFSSVGELASNLGYFNSSEDQRSLRSWRISDDDNLPTKAGYAIGYCTLGVALTTGVLVGLYMGLRE